MNFWFAESSPLVHVSCVCNKRDHMHDIDAVMLDVRVLVGVELFAKILICLFYFAVGGILLDAK